MFFLGSFNSAIPYIVYLSVIWAFMLIGSGGSVHFFRNADQVHQEHHISIYQPYSETHHGNFNSARNIPNNGPALCSLNDYTCSHIILREVLYPEFQPGSVGSYSGLNTLRGPPVQFC